METGRHDLDGRKKAVTEPVWKKPRMDNQKANDLAGVVAVRPAVEEPPGRKDAAKAICATRAGLRQRLGGKAEVACCAEAVVEDVAEAR